VLEAQFPETAETQPELLAHHYTEASLLPQAIRYWQRAGERASQRSAHVEAIAHLTKGLALLMTLPETRDRARQELALQATLGPTLMVTKGFAAPEVVRAYARARELCQQGGDTAGLFPVVWGLHRFYQARAELRTAHELGTQLLSLAHRTQDAVALMEAHRALGQTLLQIGELPSALEHLEQGIALYDPQHHDSVAFRYGADPKVICLCHTALALWRLGYPDRALERSHQALTLARNLGHPFSLANAQFWAAWVHQFRREQTAAHEQAEAAITLATAQGFPLAVAFGTLIRGWALAAQGQAAAGLGHIRQSLADWRATGGELHRPYFLALLAEACGRMGASEEGLCVLDEALTIVNTTTAHQWEAELYRLKGELLQQAIGTGDVHASPTEVSRPAVTSAGNAGQSSLFIEAEACFRQALDIARRQEAKALELRAAVSLARLWQQQGQRVEACELLAPIYGWFTEGFDTADLQDAKVLLDELA
jgi:predicted ATPase